MTDVKRPVNKRNTKKAAELASSSAPVQVADTPVVESQAASMTFEVPAQVETVEQTEPAKKKATPKVDNMKTYISAARVRKDVDTKNLNRVNEEKAEELKLTISEYVAYEKAVVAKTLEGEELTKATAYLEANKERYEGVEQQLKALSRDRIRFSHSASLIIAILCDEFVKQLASFAMSKTIESGKKNVYVSHVHSAGIEKLSLYALVKDLPTFVQTSEKMKAELLEEAKALEVKHLLVQAEKDFKKKYQLTKEQKEKEKADKKALSDAAKEASKEAPKEVAKETPKESTTESHVEDAAEDAAEEDATSYKYYIKKLFDNNKPNEVSLRISKEIKTYLSKLVDEFLDRLSNQVRLTIINMKNRTVNETAILHTVKSMLINFQTPHEELSFTTVEGKCEVVHTRKYPTSGYSELKSSVLERLAKFKALHEGNPEALETATSVQ